jgi:hypothetical protein
MTKRLSTIAAMMCLCLPAGGGRMAAQARSVAQDFDTTRTTILTGHVATIVMQFTDTTYILLDIERGPGKTERWAVAGDSASKLGWNPKTAPVKPSDAITVAAFPARAGTDLVPSLPANHAALAEIATAGRLVRGTEITLADGRKLVFGSR